MKTKLQKPGITIIFTAALTAKKSDKHRFHFVAEVMVHCGRIKCRTISNMMRHWERLSVRFVRQASRESFAQT